MYDVEIIDGASLYLKFLEKIDLKNINDAIQGDIINKIHRKTSLLDIRIQITDQIAIDLDRLNDV